MRACPACLSVYSTDAEFCGLDGERLVEPSGDPLAGRIVGRYRLEQQIGSGASGLVYRATVLESGAEVAVKLLYGEAACDRRVVQRFRREAEAASRMRHPNIVSVTDFEVMPGGLAYLVMELLSGETLDDAIQREAPFAPDRAARIAQQISAGLAEAHSLGFLHRDLKPGNVMVARRGTKEVVKILDFGIVGTMHREQNETRLTKVGFVVGTPAYMAPEQIDESIELGPPADVYALGAILYEMLAGRPPFTGTVEQILVRKLTREPDPLLEHGEVGNLALAMLSRDPHARPPTALHVSAELHRLDLISADPKTVLAPAPWSSDIINAPTIPFDGSAGTDPFGPPSISEPIRPRIHSVSAPAASDVRLGSVIGDALTRRASLRPPSGVEDTSLAETQARVEWLREAPRDPPPPEPERIEDPWREAASADGEPFELGESAFVGGGSLAVGAGSFAAEERGPGAQAAPSSAPGESTHGEDGEHGEAGFVTGPEELPRLDSRNLPDPSRGPAEMPSFTLISGERVSLSILNEPTDRRAEPIDVRAAMLQPAATGGAGPLEELIETLAERSPGSPSAVAARELAEELRALDAALGGDPEDQVRRTLVGPKPLGDPTVFDATAIADLRAAAGLGASEPPPVDPHAKTTPGKERPARVSEPWAGNRLTYGIVGALGFGIGLFAVLLFLWLRQDEEVYAVPSRPGIPRSTRVAPPRRIADPPGGTETGTPAPGVVRPQARPAQSSSVAIP